MKLTKSNVRTRLSTRTLSDNMTVNLLTPSITEFDPTPAVNHWLSSSTAPRRPNFMDKERGSAYKRRKIDPILVANDVDNIPGDSDKENSQEVEDVSEDVSTPSSQEADIHEDEAPRLAIDEDKDSDLSEDDLDEGFEDNYNSEEDDNELQENEVFENLAKEIEEMDGLL